MVNPNMTRYRKDGLLDKRIDTGFTRLNHPVLLVLTEKTRLPVLENLSENKPLSLQVVYILFLDTTHYQNLHAKWVDL